MSGVCEERELRLSDDDDQFSVMGSTFCPIATSPLTATTMFWKALLEQWMRNDFLLCVNYMYFQCDMQLS